MGNKGSKSKPKKKKGHFRVLTLGISGSGKSTFAKQMKILYGGGFSQDEVLNYRDILLKNAMIGMQELVKQADKLEHHVSQENKKRARFFREMNAFDQPWTPNIGEKLKGLWQDPAIQQTWSSASEYQLQMSLMDYHMASLDRYTAEGFVPTNEDMLRARQRTTGMQVSTFAVENYDWTLIDVGGQRPERAKWEQIMLQDNNACIIFFAALDEFNMVSAEESNKTKMQIALQTFDEIVNAEAAKSCTMLLFLNKVDLFKKKIGTPKDLEYFQKTFPDYTGGTDIEKATQYVASRFSSLMRTRPQDDLHVHVTCALDTDAMDTVFKAVKETLFVNRMQASGIKL